MSREDGEPVYCQGSGRPVPGAAEGRYARCGAWCGAPYVRVTMEYAWAQLDADIAEFTIPARWLLQWRMRRARRLLRRLNEAALRRWFPS